jgi:hypothetical protein
MRITVFLLAAAAIAAPQIARADEPPSFLRAPVAAAAPAVSLAVDYEFNFRLAHGRDLANRLVEAGVDVDDAAAADRLAAGHDQCGPSGCYVKVAISKDSTSGRFTLQRVTLLTKTSQTVLERRHGALAISATGARTAKRSGLV